MTAATLDLTLPKKSPLERTYVLLNREEKKILQKIASYDETTQSRLIRKFVKEGIQIWANINSSKNA